MSTPLKQKDAWYDIWTKVVSTVFASAIIGCCGALLSALLFLFSAAGRQLLETPLPIPSWVALLGAVLFFLTIVIAIAIVRRSKPQVKTKLINVEHRIAPTNIPFRLKVYCEMRNDSNCPVDVRIDDYISKDVRVTRITPGALQLKFQPGGPWLPEPSAERVAVCPGQTFRAWIAPDEALFSKESFERLRGQMGTGQMGTLVLNVNGQKINVAL